MWSVSYCQVGPRVARRFAIAVNLGKRFDPSTQCVSVPLASLLSAPPVFGRRQVPKAQRCELPGKYPDSGPLNRINDQREAAPGALPGARLLLVEDRQTLADKLLYLLVRVPASAQKRFCPFVSQRSPAPSDLVIQLPQERFRSLVSQFSASPRSSHVTTEKRLLLAAGLVVADSAELRQ